MSTIYEFPQRTDAVEEACGWLAKLDRGLVNDEAAALRAWLAADAGHVNVLLEVAEKWDRMDCLSRLSDLFPQPRNQWIMQPRYIAAIVAVILLAGMTSFWWNLGADIFRTLSDNESSPASLSTQAEDRIFETGIGKFSTAYLSDGSQLVLNTQTKVHVTFTDRERHIELLRGEINIKVAHDKARPLDVYAGDKIVRAVGTAFNVELKPGRQIELIVTEGTVRVGTIRSKTPEAAPSELSTYSRDFTATVDAGEQVILGSGDEKVSHIKSDEINARLSWRTGNLVFHGEPLKDAVEEINKYTPIKVVIEQESLKERRISGLFKSGDLEGLLASLQANFNISHRYINPEEVVLTVD